MKRKKLFLWLLFSLIILIGMVVFLIIQEKNSVSLSQNMVKQDQIAPPIQRTLSEAQQDINQLLSKKMLSFDDNRSPFQDNSEVLNSLIEILDSMEEENIALIVSAFCNEMESRGENRKLSQKRADIVAHYIDEQYAPLFINAIGYGEEFSSLDGNSTQKSSRIEIEIKRVIEEPLN